MKAQVTKLVRVLMVTITAAALSLIASGCSDLTCEDDCTDSLEQTACELCSIGPVPESNCVEDNCLD